MIILKKLDRYILKEVITTYFFTVATFMFLLYTGAFLKQMEMGLPLGKIITYTPFLIMMNIPFVLPLGFITGYILTFSRLSADREIQIIRTSGIPLLRIILPHLTAVFIISIAASYIYQVTIPQSRKNFRNKLISVYREIPPVAETYNKPSLLLNDEKDRIYVIGKDGDTINGIAVQHVENGRISQFMYAEKASIQRKSPTLLTFSMEQVTRLIIDNTYIDNPFFKELKIDVPIIDEDTDEAAGSDYALMTGKELQQYYRNPENPESQRRRAHLRFWLRLSLAWACFSFTIFAVPAGILSSGKSKASGFIKSILLSLIVFFPLLMGLRSYLMNHYGLNANLMMLPNWVFIIYGIYLLRKVLKI